MEQFIEDIKEFTLKYPFLKSIEVDDEVISKLTDCFSKYDFCAKSQIGFRRHIMLNGIHIWSDYKFTPIKELMCETNEA